MKKDIIQMILGIISSVAYVTLLILYAYQYFIEGKDVPVFVALVILILYHYASEK